MNLNIIKEIIAGFVHAMRTSLWLEVSTTEPCCIYYFGPFDRIKEAEAARSGYLEDLEGEGAKGIVTTIKRCTPMVLTIEPELTINRGIAES